MSVTVVSCLLLALASADRPLMAEPLTRDTPTSQGVDEEGLRRAVEYMDTHFRPDGARQLVILRNGRLIYEGPKADANHPLYSCTKVFTSTLLGLLVGDGKCTLDTPVTDVLPELDDDYPAYARLRLRHLASMTGGYQGTVEKVAHDQPWGDPLAYFQPLSPYFEPGTQIAYSDHDVHLLGRVLLRLAGESLADLFRKRIAEPIGMFRWEWGTCGTADGLTYHNAAGTPCARGGGGVRTSARELARLGQLYLNCGTWNGAQLLPPEFVDEATRNQVPADMPGRSSRLLAGRYGFYWWTNGLRADGTRPWPSAPPNAYMAHGHGANYCFVIPEWQMVIVRLGSDPIAETGQDEPMWDGFFARLAPAVLRRGSATRITLAGGKWHINGVVTYPGSRAEGLLMNVRMVNSVFEDRNRPEFDPEANTREFIARIPEYVAHGVRAFTINLQGGFPGYEGALNSAFEPDGSLRESYLSRVGQVIEACDQAGAAVILGCFYQRQDQVLRDQSAVRVGVVNTVRWIVRSGFTNVMLEIANEFGHSGFDHPLLRSAEGQAELIALARQTAVAEGRSSNLGRLLVSTSGLGDGRFLDIVAEASDFLMPHLNSTPVEAIPDRMAELRRFGKPIVVNEDDKIGEEGARAAKTCVDLGVSWGFMAKEVNQYYPFTFGGPTDDLVVYAKLKELTSQR